MKEDETKRTAPAPLFQKFEAWLRSDLVRGYEARGGLICAYAQGSLVENLAAEADIDVVLVWEDDAPPASERPPPGLADPAPQPVVFDEPNFLVDRFWRGGQQFDVKHVTQAELASWVEAVEAGGGRSGYPMPAIAIHGLVHAVVLTDRDDYVAGIRERMKHVPSAFRRNARLHKDAADSFLNELDQCVKRADYLLFHSLAANALRAAFISWFAARDQYWPHEKRLSQRLTIAGRPDLAELERKAWSGKSLAARLTAIRDLICRLRDES